jgi:hypothetical protein
MIFAGSAPASAVDVSNLPPIRPIENLSVVSDSAEELEQMVKSAKSNGTLFGDRFEVEFQAPVLTGELRFASRSYFSPSPQGTTLKSLSQALADADGLQYLQGDTSYMGQLDPTPTTYLNRVDFLRMRHTYGGYVEAPVTAVDLSLSNPSASTSGCEPEDFRNFPVGDIALLQRGTCQFQQKARNAGAAGAVGVVIFNQGTPDRQGVFSGNLPVDYDRLEPVVSTSFAQGQAWAELAARRQLVLAMNIEEGTDASAWRLKPIPSAIASAPTFWITNVDSGKSLYSAGPVRVEGEQAREVALGNVDPNDRDGHWRFVFDEQTGNARIQNVATSQYLAARSQASLGYLFTAGSFSLRNVICTTDPSCDQWTVGERMQPPPSGAARIRSALGDFYLRSSGNEPEASPIKSGWGDALWVMEVIGNSSFRRLKNIMTDQYLHIINGPVELSDVPNINGWRVHWELVPASNLSQINTPNGDGAVARNFPISNAVGYYLIRNRMNDELLARRNGRLEAVSGPTDTLDVLWVIEDQNITIADDALRGAINAQLGQSPNAPIRSSEAAGMDYLFAGGMGVSDLSGLENLYNLRDLRLGASPFTDVTPIASLEKLEKLNLVDSAVSNMDPLLLNEGLGREDVVLITGSPLRLDDFATGQIFRAKNIWSVPFPGEIALREVGTRRVVSAQSLEMVDYADLNPNLDASFSVRARSASFSLEYVFHPDGPRYHITGYPIRSGERQYLDATDQGGGWEMLWNDNDPGSSGEFSLVQVIGRQGEYRLRHESSSTPSYGASYLLVCGTDVTIRDSSADCREVVFGISEDYIFDVNRLGEENLYNPDFFPPDRGFTRIQHTQTREFLAASSRASVELLEIPDDNEGLRDAHWELVPIQMESNYLFIIRNREYSDRYLYRTINGDLVLTVLPFGEPTDASWVFVEDNKPFVFDLRGDSFEVYSVRPFQQPGNANLRERNGRVEFSDQLSPSSFWRFDSGVPVADVPTKTVVLQRPTESVLDSWSASFFLRWFEPVAANSEEMKEETRVGEGVYEIPVTARDVELIINCNDCNWAWSDGYERVFDQYWQRPQDLCFEAYGVNTNPRVRACDATEGRLANLAANIVDEYACPFVVATEYVLDTYNDKGYDEISALLASEDLEGAKRALITDSDLIADFLDCESPFITASFGTGGQGSLLGAEESGEIGLAWSIVDPKAPVVSYSSISREVNPQWRFLSASLVDAASWWLVEPSDLRGRAIGLTLNSNLVKNRTVKAALIASKATEFAGVSLNVTVWLQCDTGAGEVIANDYCEVREDSKFLGVTMDSVAGTDISVPKVNGVGILYSETCVPAGVNRLGDCPR